MVAQGVSVYNSLEQFRIFHSYYKHIGFVKGSGMYGVLHTSRHEISAWVEMF